MPYRLLFLFLLLALGCGTRTEPTGRTVEDDLGRPVSVPADVRRIVTLAPSVTELAFAAGAGPHVVGVTQADDEPEPVLSLPRIQALPVDFEAITALGPDLVLASDQVNDPRDAERLGALGIPTYFVSVRSLDDVIRSVDALGGLLGTSTAARRAADSLRARLADTRAPGPGPGPEVLVLIGDETLFSFGRDSYVHDMVARAGGRSITASFEVRAPILSDEYVISAAPDVIVGAFGSEYPPGRLSDLHPQWHDVPAIRNGRVYSLDPDLLLRPGPRLVRGVEALRDVLSGMAAGAQ